VLQFQEEEVGEASLCDEERLGGQCMQQVRVINWLNVVNSVLKLEIMWKSDYAQLSIKAAGKSIFLFHLNISFPSLFL